MADPRFYDNRGPFTLAEVCAEIGVAVPEGADGALKIEDVASLTGAVAAHLTFFNADKASPEFQQTRAAVCLFPENPKGRIQDFPAGTVIVRVGSVQHAFAAVVELFYPDCNRISGPFTPGIHPTARIGTDVLIGPGVVVGAGAEIGDGTRLGPNTVIGRGVAIGRHCDISGNTTIVCTYMGDNVLVLPGAQIGQPGFRFASAPQGHVKIGQLGRVIVQDRVEIGACTTIDRGGLGDTVVGEGTKIDNLVQIGHNTQIGRHCIIVSQVGISGSSTLGDYVVLGGQVGISDHCTIGPGARLGGRAAMTIGMELEGGKDYGGVPAKPLRDWIREVYAVNQLIKKPKRGGND